MTDNHSPSVTYNPRPYEFRNEHMERRIQSLERENAKLRSQLRNSLRKTGWRKQVKRYVPAPNSVSPWVQMLNLIIVLSVLRDDKSQRTTLSEIVALAEFVTDEVIVPDDKPLDAKQRSARYLLWEFPPACGGWEKTDFASDEDWCFETVGSIAATWLAELCLENPDD